ncbi:MAG TPA: ATP-binding protein [Anaerolineae bacterium]|nr:ATP-binding protein [Anaerolineae bacterium]
MSEPARRGGLSHLVTRLIRGSEKSPATPEREVPTLRVTTHVARDLLQNAAYFNSIPKTVAEYVTNAIDNRLPDQPVHCEVTLSRQAIRIADDAGGMTHTELSNFFQMHGENAQRRRGRAVRGKFGTGKSAAFGIANTLRVETVKAGRRNVVELRRADVEAARDGQPIPVHEVIVDAATGAHSGTLIVINDLNVKNVDADAVRAYLEKTLGRHLRLQQVAVNDVACKYREPASAKSFRFKAPRETVQLAGPATCVLKISREPLGRDENTIAVLCNGFLHATTLAGKQAEPFVEYIFGEVEAPGLDADGEPLPAFDNTRSLTLNPQNPRVQALLDWLAECIETVRRELVARDKRRRYSKEMRLLRRVAGEIQDFLDEDFRVVQATMPWATLSGRRRGKSKRRSAPDATAPAAPSPGITLLERGRVLVNRVLGREAPTAQADAGQALANLRRGGRVRFEIHYVRLGPAAPRSRFIANRRALYLNRDHPQLRAAEGEAGVESLTFRLLSSEIAFTAYALAVVSQLADQGIEVADPIDASEMIQEILDRLGRKAAERFTLQASAAPGVEDSLAGGGAETPEVQVESRDGESQA